MLRPQHTIFDVPFKANLNVEQTPPPDNFKKWKPTVGKTIPTFPIFTKPEGDKSEPGLVTSDFGFEEFPDAEIILGGVNMKGPDYAAVARHGSVIQWGFHCTPDRFTDAGRRLYLNSVAYAFKHKGSVVESLRRRPTRSDLEHAFTTYLGLYPEKDWKKMLTRHYAGEEIPESILKDEAAKRAWLDERLPFIRPVNSGDDWATAYQLTVDAEAKSIGVRTDSVAFLDALAARLLKDPHDKTANALVSRYVPNVSVAELPAWLKDNRERLYFTEGDGWVWRVRGTRALSLGLRVKEAASPDDPVAITATATDTMLTITLRIRDGWHVYAPGAKDGDPIQVTIRDDSSLVAAGEPVFNKDEKSVMSGRGTIEIPLKRAKPGSTIHVSITYTACDASTCRPPRTITLSR